MGRDLGVIRGVGKYQNILYKYNLILKEKFKVRKEKKKEKKNKSILCTKLVKQLFLPFPYGGIPFFRTVY